MASLLVVSSVGRAVCCLQSGAQQMGGPPAQRLQGACTAPPADAPPQTRPAWSTTTDGCLASCPRPHSSEPIPRCVIPPSWGRTPRQPPTSTADTPPGPYDSPNSLSACLWDLHPHHQQLCRACGPSSPLHLSVPGHLLPGRSGSQSEGPSSKAEEPWLLGGAVHLCPQAVFLSLPVHLPALQEPNPSSNPPPIALRQSF